MRLEMRLRASESPLRTPEQDLTRATKALLRWRRRRDLNPREAVDLNPLSRRAP